MRNLIFLALSLFSFSAFAQKSISKTKIVQQSKDATIQVNLVQNVVSKASTTISKEADISKWKSMVNGHTEVEFDKPVKLNGIPLKAGKYYLLLFPGNDWKPKSDEVNKFPGNDWQPRNSKIAFPGNDWSPKDSKLKFPGNDWKPKRSSKKFPGNDWKPVNGLMEEFPGNDWLVVFYRQDKNSKGKAGIAAEMLIKPEQLLQPSSGLSANVVNFAGKGSNINISMDKTLIAIPIEVN